MESTPGDVEPQLNMTILWRTTLQSTDWVLVHHPDNRSHIAIHAPDLKRCR